LHVLEDNGQEEVEEVEVGANDIQLDLETAYTGLLEGDMKGLILDRLVQA
jgi:hypothetical protein